ncbi:MAG: hypothetical protein AAB618_03580 [Patescibacteria group bacterium]
MRHHAWLYSAVFAGRFSTLLIFILLASFAIQPFHKAIASESIEVPAEEAAPIASDVNLEEPEPESPVEVPATEDIVPENETSEDVVEIDTEPPAEEVLEVEVPEEDTVTEEVIDTPISEEEETVPVDPIDTTDQDQTDDIEATTTKETEVVTGSVVEAQYIVTEENYYQFNKNACVSVGDGAFHCSSNTKNELDTQSVAYSEQGTSGNMEIFLKTSRGKVKQITENAFDDTAPHYDAESMRLVWQRLIDGRYQVVLYDIMSESETQLTFSKTNNMEPKVSDAGIVWQAWDNNDWEVMYFDGVYTEQLTNNEGQDVAPVIQDGYVLWSVLGLEDQEARVYSLDTKETTSITGHDGGSISNPRFVLVYDTEFENGDTLTQSFDPNTGLSEAVAARPAPEPIDIPETDPTGEIRALLIQGKTQKDEKDITDLSPDDTATSTPDEPGTLNLNQNPDDGAATIILPTENNFELTEFDLVIPTNALQDALSSTQ